MTDREKLVFGTLVALMVKTKGFFFRPTMVAKFAGLTYSQTVRTLRALKTKGHVKQVSNRDEFIGNELHFGVTWDAEKCQKIMHTTNPNDHLRDFSTKWVLDQLGSLKLKKKA